MGPPPMIYFAVLLAVLFSSQSPYVVDTASLDTDKEALFSFKSLITADPSNTLFSWNQNSTPCNWTGIICDKSNQRVVGIELQGLGLAGTISPHLSNLSFLQFLHLQNNKFAGALPNQIGDLSSLRDLNMSFNLIQGAIPPNISSCMELVVLDLMQNQISGGIPTVLDRLSKLQVLRLNGNQLSGAIPPSIGNLSSLTTLELTTNSLGGSIPSDLGRLQNLIILELSINNFTGFVPSSLYNISSLVVFALASNQLWGEIPDDLGVKLPNLLSFNFCFNNFTGSIPGSLHNLTNIQNIRLAWNFLAGSVPPGLGNLHDLKMYNIRYNRIISSGDAGLSLITSLTNSTSLSILAVDGNLLEGVIPEAIGNLSTTLTHLYLGRNRIYGSIPTSIGRLSKLGLLNLSHNLISGELPSEIGQLKELQMLGLAGNRISGKIPVSLGNLSKLNGLELFGNELVGRIPETFVNYQHLLSMDLSNNRLSGNIPKQILRLSGLSSVLNLSKNYLSGPLAQEVGILENLVTVDLSHNQLSGIIPESIGNCKSLEDLFMANNLFSGSIPATLGSLKGLKSLDLSSNKLSGPIPSVLQELQVLQFLNLSFNDLEGEVPRDGIFRNLSGVHLEGNSKLCFPSVGKNSKGHGKRSIAVRVIIPIMGSISLCVLMGLFIMIFLNRRRITAKITAISETPLKRQHQMVSYNELRTATGNFKQINLVGSGSFGSVYKGTLREGTVVGVKVFDRQRTGALKSFFAECEALRNARHRNLVKVITSCSSVDFRNVGFQALVYEFMGNGSLEDWIRRRRRHENGEGLNIVERLNAAIDVACAMDYLHHDCQPPVVHCDLKPSNVLLDDDMTAKVGDFGLAKLLIVKTGNHHSTTATHGLKGSLGYIPPEYGLGGNPSTRGDVYSYGVMLLELFTGKSPIHEIFVGGISLAKWVQSAFPANTGEVLDPELLLPMDGARQPMSQKMQQQCLISIIKVGLCCVVYSPELRISMKDVLHTLKNIRATLLNTSVENI